MIEDNHVGFTRDELSYMFNNVCTMQLAVVFYHSPCCIIIITILINWYNNQDMCVRWGDSYSAKFKVTNGVIQGGILSPYLFNVYLSFGMNYQPH